MCIRDRKQWLERLKREEALDPERYRNSGMLLRLPNGLAVEPVLIRKKFLKWQDAHPEFPRIVFHGLRHSSATYQLMISGGDIKAVQGTTGHASADMLVNTYAPVSYTHLDVYKRQPLHFDQIPFGAQFFHGTAHRDAADRVLRTQLRLRGDLLVGFVLAALDRGTNVILYLLVKRDDSTIIDRHEIPHPQIEYIVINIIFISWL